MASSEVWRVDPDTNPLKASPSLSIPEAWLGISQIADAVVLQHVWEAGCEVSSQSDSRRASEEWLIEPASAADEKRPVSLKAGMAVP